jgi:hypothetical protein
VIQHANIDRLARQGARRCSRRRSPHRGCSIAFEWAPSDCATVAQHQAENIHVRDGIAGADFVAGRTARMRLIGMPALMLPSLQLNIRAGHRCPMRTAPCIYAVQSTTSEGS